MSELVEIVKATSPAFLGVIAAYMTVRESIAKMTAILDSLIKRVDRIESRVDTLPRQ